MHQLKFMHHILRNSIKNLLCINKHHINQMFTNQGIHVLQEKHIIDLSIYIITFFSFYHWFWISVANHVPGGAGFSEKAVIFVLFDNRAGFTLDRLSNAWANKRGFPIAADSCSRRNCLRRLFDHISWQSWFNGRLKRDKYWITEFLYLIITLIIYKWKNKGIQRIKQNLTDTHQE